MNARSRSEAIKGLENLAFIICVHIVLIDNFSNDSACGHWQGEIKGFAKTLKRYNKATGKRKSNYTKEIICLSLNEIVEDSTLQADIEDFIAAKGFPVENLNYSVGGSIEQFADDVLNF